MKNSPQTRYAPIPIRFFKEWSSFQGRIFEATMRAMQEQASEKAQTFLRKSKMRSDKRRTYNILLNSNGEKQGRIK